MAEWERQERHLVTVTGPPVVDAVDLIVALHRAISDYRLIANEPPNAELPAGAVTLSAAGGVLTVRIEHVERMEPTGDQPVEAPDVEEGEGNG